MKKDVKFWDWIGVLIVLIGIPLFLVFGLYIPDAWWQAVFHGR